MDNLFSRYESLCVKYLALGGLRLDHDLCYGLFSLVPPKFHLTSQMVKSTTESNGVYELDKVIAAYYELRIREELVQRLQTDSKAKTKLTTTREQISKVTSPRLTVQPGKTRYSFCFFTSHSSSVCKFKDFKCSTCKQSANAHKLLWAMASMQ